MERVRFGVIGTGRMGTHHARNLAGRICGANLVALADVDQERAAGLARELGGITAWGDYRALIEDRAVDAVVIAASTDRREEMLAAALRSHKPIFCEKPLALDLAAIARIRTLAAQSRSIVQLGFMRRFDPGYDAAWRSLRAGAIGKPIAMSAVSYDPGLASYDYIAGSGGLFADLAIHDFDLARFLMADEVSRVFAVGGIYKYERLSEFGDIDNGLVTLQFACGGFGSVQGSRNAAYGYDIRTEVLGTEGAIRIGYERQTPVLWLRAGGVNHDFVPFFLERFRDAYELEMQAFVEAIRTGASPPVGLEDGERALAIAVAARTSLACGRPEEVPLRCSASA